MFARTRRTDAIGGTFTLPLDPTPTTRRETSTFPVLVQYKPRDSPLHYAKIELDIDHHLLLRQGLRSFFPHQTRFPETSSCLSCRGPRAVFYVCYVHDVLSETQGVASQNKGQSSGAEYGVRLPATWC